MPELMESEKPKNESNNDNAVSSSGNNSVSVSDTIVSFIERDIHLHDEILTSLSEIHQTLLLISEATSTSNLAIQNVESTLRDIQGGLNQNRNPVVANQPALEMEANIVREQSRVDDRIAVALLIFSVMGQYSSFVVSLSNRMKHATGWGLTAVAGGIIAICLVLSGICWAVLRRYGRIGLQRHVRR